MAPLRMILPVFFIVTGVMSKTISLSAVQDSKCPESAEANSSEEVGAEDNTSQETLQHSGTDAPNTVEPTGPPLTSPDATALPGPEIILPDTSAMPDLSNLQPDTSAMPDVGNPQDANTTALQVMPNDPSQTGLGVEVSQDMPESHLAHDNVNAEQVKYGPDKDIDGTRTQGVAHHGYPQGATPPFLDPAQDNIITHARPDMNLGHQTQSRVTIIKHHGMPKDFTPPSPHIIPTIPPEVYVNLPNGIPFSTDVPVCFTFQFEPLEPEPARGDSM